MEQNLSKKTRTESDLIGSREVPESALYGVQTLRGIENFRISKFHDDCYYARFARIGWFSSYELPIYSWWKLVMAYDRGTIDSCC